ncbi:MAG: histidinol-phosphate transaminase [Ignavibacteriales bacterium]|nr:MAG: histidinol-phosphate transaminase [Ignavibacteriales bacterium]
MSIKLLVRENIRELKPYTSARDIYTSGILLDANENPRSILEKNYPGISRYPDPHHRNLREKLAAYHGISPAQILAGNGSDELLDLCIRVFCAPGKESALIIEPTYGMYKTLCEINDIRVIICVPEEIYEPDMKQAAEAIEKNTKIAFICNPNNPTGGLISPGFIEGLLKRPGMMVVCDEAYIDFAPKGSALPLLAKYNNLIILRTFSKAWGLAGIRCGYIIAHPEVIHYLEAVKYPYNVNRITLSLAERALDNLNMKEELITSLISERERITAFLKELKGVERVFHSDANFILFRSPHSGYIFNRLAEKGIIIRDRSSQPGLSGCLRVSIGLPAENDKFMNIVKEVLNETAD